MDLQWNLILNKHREEIRRVIRAQKRVAMALTIFTARFEEKQKKTKIPSTDGKTIFISLVQFLK
jgi:hypothetical protein